MPCTPRIRCLAWSAALLTTTSPAFAADTHVSTRIEEPHACVQVGLVPGAGGQLDLGKTLSPKYQVGARLSGQDCDAVTWHAVDVKNVPSVVAALRRLGAMLAAQEPAAAPLAACYATKGSITFAETAPKVEGTAIDLPLRACGEDRRVLVTLHTTDAGPEVASLEVIPPASAPEVQQAIAAEHMAKPLWKPDKLRIDAALKRESSSTGSGEDEINIYIESVWDRGADHTVLTLDNDYERDDGETFEREMSGRVIWTHDFVPGWFGMFQGYAERNDMSYLGTRYDYLLLQAAGGGGYRWKWGHRATVRLAALWNEFDVKLIDVDADVRDRAPSTYLSANWDITERFSAQGWAQFYFWGADDLGRDIEAELHYELSRHLGFGLRWTLTRNAASLERTDEEETKLFLRYRF